MLSDTRTASLQQRLRGLRSRFLLEGAPRALQELELSLRRALERHPPLFDRVYRRLGGGPEQRRVSPASDLVIEGFPRSANSFCFRAMQLAHIDARCRRASGPASPPELRLAGHTHSPGSVRLAVALGKPVCLLLRRPEDAVRSLWVKFPGSLPAVLLRGYATFYEDLWPVREGIVAGTFEEVTRDFGAVAERVNRRFGSRFPVFEHTAENVARVQSSFATSAFEMGLGLGGGPMPHPERERRKRQLSFERYEELLERCRRIHERWHKQAGVP